MLEGFAWCFAFSCWLTARSSRPPQREEMAKKVGLDFNLTLEMKTSSLVKSINNFYRTTVLGSWAHCFWINFAFLSTDSANSAAIEELKKQISDIAQELNLLKEQQALQTGIFLQKKWFNNSSTNMLYVKYLTPNGAADCISYFKRQLNSFCVMQSQK